MLFPAQNWNMSLFLTYFVCEHLKYVVQYLTVVEGF